MRKKVRSKFYIDVLMPFRKKISMEKSLFAMIQVGIENLMELHQ